jgi:hypothetical protein
VGRQVSGLPRWAAALPAAAVGAASALLVVLSAAGINPVWATQPMTMSEAAVMRDPAMVARGIASGEDPYVARTVRRGLLVEQDLELTALEAAIGARRGEVVEYLLFAAPPRDAATWERATCLAAAVGDRDVTAVLDKARPASIVARCEGYVRPW